MRYYLLASVLLTTHILAFLSAQSPFPYDLDNPQLVAELDDELAEISGLSLQADELLAVQDEDGIIFRIDLATGRVVEQYPFGDGGDYEGIEHVGQHVYVTKSSGTLYRVARSGEKVQQVDKFNGFLNGENDVEGLVHDPGHNRLLLACKAPDISPDARHIYAFDLSSKTFSEEPVLAISKNEIQDYLTHCDPADRHDHIYELFMDEDKYKLGPSALAIHPHTGQYFVTSSRGKLLIVLSRSGRIERMLHLDSDRFPQPEGLAFAPDGTLYISTEAKKGEPARIWKVVSQ